MTRVRLLPLALPLALLTIACGRPRISIDASAGSEDDDSTEVTTDATSETTTSTPPDTDTGDGDGDGDPSTSLTFVPSEDGGFPGPTSCDGFAQDCPEGEKCVPYASTGGTWDASKCVVVTGAQMPGETCNYGGAVEATDDCDATSMCWDVVDIEGVPTGTCAPFCMGTPDAPECPEPAGCIDELINVCVYPCDPVAQDCDDGLGCYWDGGGGFICAFTSEDIPPGQPCGFINDCEPGAVCLNAEFVPGCMDAACCTLFCDLNLGDMQCDAIPGSSCVAFFEEGTAPIGQEHVGVCIVP